MADKIPAKGKWEGGSKGSNGPSMIDMGHGTMASPDAANEIITERRRGRATRRHQKEHPETIERSPIRAFMLGKDSGYKKVSEDTPKEKEEHIQKKMADSKRHKKYENQK